MPKVILIFATEREALPTIHALEAQAHPSLPSTYVFSNGWILLSQMGLLASHHAVLTAMAHFGNQTDEIINLGFSAALGAGAKIGEIHRIGSVGKYTLLPEGIDEGSRKIHDHIYPPLSIADSGQRLLSCDFPIHNQTLKAQMQSNWDLVDMEGYAIAYGALRMKKRVSLFKITSDFAMKGGRELILRHHHELAQSLASFVLSRLG